MSPATTHRSRETVFADVQEMLRGAVTEVKAYLASPEGQRMRSRAATGLILAAPVISRLPWMRVSRLGRLVGLAGGAALLVKVGELIREWEPQLGESPVGTSAPDQR
jgi:hypothetical protein